MIPNFTKLNDLPSFNESGVKDLSSNIVNENVYIRDLDYYYTNSISRASKTMSECRQIKQNSKKLVRIINDRIFTTLGQEVYKILFLLVPILVSVMIVWLDRRVWDSLKEGPNVVGPFGLFKH